VLKFILKILFTAVVILGLARLLPGVHIDSYWTAILVAVVLAVLNAFLRPVLIFLTLPATLISFGLFLFVINAAIILLDAYFVHGFHIVNFWWALLFSILLSVILSFFDGLEKQQNTDNSEKGH
jgi:putative membrane protein